MAANSEQLEHIEWLVSRRSLNQASTKDLYVLFSERRDFLNYKTQHRERIIANILLSIAFSLWRAVFLSDVGDAGDFFEHAEAFLLNLIEHNAVSYTQDFKSRKWTFRYYLNAAKNELDNLEGYDDMALLEGYDFKKIGSLKENWDTLQGGLSHATERFANLLLERDKEE